LKTISGSPGAISVIRAASIEIVAGAESAQGQPQQSLRDYRWKSGGIAAQDLA
jgi:hypothetical protein